jgi:chromosome segregation ATPase
MEKEAANLSEYKESCASLSDLIEKKDAVIHELELEVEHGRKELAKQVMLTEQGEQELTLLSQQLESETKMHGNLKVELATSDEIMKEFNLQKRALEEEISELKGSLSIATEGLKEKALEIQEQRGRIERLETLAAQQGDAHAVKAKELQITSNAAEERDKKLSIVQSALNKAHDDLQKAYELVSTKEGEKRALSVRLSEMESLVEAGNSQISQLQSSLQLARANLEAETERVWHQVAARNEIETELDVWKAKAAALVESSAAFERSINKLQAEVNEWKSIAEHTENLSLMELDAWKVRLASLTESNATKRAEFESSLKESKVEVEEWKEIAENTRFLNAELGKSLHAIQESVTGWEKVVTSLADEGDAMKQHLEFSLKQVHEEFRCLQEDLVNSKELMSIACREGKTLKVEFLAFFKDSQAQVKAHSALAAVTGTEERERHLQAVVSDLRRELSVWEAKAAHSSATEVSFLEAQSQLKEWRRRAEEWESFNGIVEQAFLDFEHALLECKSDVAPIDDLGRNMKLDIQLLFQTVRKEVEAAKSEMLELQEVTSLEAKETKLEFEGCVTALEAEVEAWKVKAAAATEEGLQMKAQFEELLKSLQGELKTWKQFETLAREERRSSKTETAPENVATVVGLEGDEPDVFTPNSINPFDQEDEGCSSGLETPDNDDAAIQLQGWKSKSSTVAKEGRKLTRQFRASFKHIQYELESRKQAPRLAKHESFVHRRDDTGLEDLVKALQEEAVEVKAELANWKHKATSAAQETADLERTISKLKAEVEGWKDRSAMSAGQRIVARRQLDDYAKQVKSLDTDLQKWKDVATEANEGSTKLQTSLESVQKENEETRAELDEWMQKALELNCRVKDLEADMEKWKHRCETRNDENRLRLEELEHLRAEVEKWKAVAVDAEEEGKSAKMELLDTLGKFEDELEVMSSNSIGECSSAGGRSLREEDLDCSTWQRSTSGRFSNEWRHTVASELETSLQAEVEDWKKKVLSGEKEQEDMRQRYETMVKELHLEVEAWKKSAACIAEDGRLKRVELEKKLQAFQATELLELQQVELETWKARAADAAEECTSLRDTHEETIKELQLELTNWKEKSEAATEEAKSVKADLEKVVQDLEHEVRTWKQQAEEALDGVTKSQEYEDLIKALEEELCLWTLRAEEGKALQLQLEKERAHLKESLTATQTELRKWKDKAAEATTSIRCLQEDVNTELESELQRWKSKANDGELLQLQLKKSLAETQTELHEWKHKAAELSLVAEALKEELDCVIEEGRVEKEELRRSTSQLEAELRTHDYRSLQAQLESSQSQLKIWEEKAAAITQSTRSLMEEFDVTVEKGQLEKLGFYDSISALETSVKVWKEKVAESESAQVELKSTLVETQSELQDWKDRAAAVAVATKSLKGEIDSILNDNRLQKEKLCNTINELEAELFEWRSRAQEGVSVQLQLEKALSDMEENVAAAASETQALKDELDSTIAESSSEINHLCTAITGLEAELSDLKQNANDNHSPQLLQLQSVLTETQSQLQEWQQRAMVASQAEGELRQAVEEIRSQTQKLHDFIRDLKNELLEWKQKAEHLETLQVHLTSSLAPSQEELQSWKQKAMDVTDSDLRNSLETELSQWKEKAQEGEVLHQRMRTSLTETQMELQEMKEKIAAFASSTDTLKDELSSANELATALTTQLSTQKQNEVTLQKLNRQLEADLVQVREEALSRKQKMTQILTQLEGTNNSQKELQSKLNLAQHRLLGNETLRSQAESAKVRIS